MKSTSLVLVLTTVVLSSCSGLGSAAAKLLDLRAVGSRVSEAVPHDHVFVNLANDQVLSVTLVNSSLGNLPPDQKERKALELALIAYKSFRSRDSLKTVEVTFAVHRRQWLIFNYDDWRDEHLFDVDDLAAKAQKVSSSTR